MRHWPLAAALIAAPALAKAMSVEEYLAKVHAIKAQGMISALTSPDAAAVKSEMQAIKASYRIDVDAARAKGKTDMGCPPPVGQVNMNGEDLDKAFRALPTATRKRTSLKAGIYQVLRNRYPCK